jgi:hypothetical protein
VDQALVNRRGFDAFDSVFLPMPRFFIAPSSRYMSCGRYIATVAMVAMVAMVAIMGIVATIAPIGLRLSGVLVLATSPYSPPLASSAPRPSALCNLTVLTLLPTPITIDGEEILEILAFGLRSHIKKCGLCYHVRWMGYSLEHDQWIPPTEVTHAGEVIAAFEKAQQETLGLDS